MAVPVIRPNALPVKAGGLVDGDSVIVNNAGNLNRATYAAPVVPPLIAGFPPLTKIITVPIDVDLHPSPGWPVVFDSEGNFGPWLRNSFFGTSPAGICLSVDSAANRADVFVRGVIKLRTVWTHLGLYEDPIPRPFYIGAVSPYTFGSTTITDDGTVAGFNQSHWTAQATRLIGTWLATALGTNGQFSWAYVDFDRYQLWEWERDEPVSHGNSWLNLPLAVGNSTYLPEYRNV